MGIVFVLFVVIVNFWVGFYYGYRVGLVCRYYLINGVVFFGL